MPDRPLEGLRIIDMCVVWAGPFATALLGDLGAEVIRVESIHYWDTNTRNVGATQEQLIANGATPDPDAGLWDLSANFNSVGRNKRSVTIDLTRPEGKEALYRLVATADMFVENNSPDLVRKLGLTYDVLSKHRPDLIMASMPAFGTTGPYSNFRAFGANMEAVVGHTLLRGYADTDASLNTNVFFADACGGATCAFALMAALRYRQQTGKGQFIDMSQAENVAHTLSQAFMDYSMNQRVQASLGNRDFANAPQGVYRCEGEDKWIAISCTDDQEFQNLCGLMGQSELAEEPRFADSLSRYRNQDELDAHIGAFTFDKEHYALFHELQAAGVPSSPVLSIAEVAEDPHLQERGIWQTLTHSATGTHEYLKSPLSHMSRTPLSIWKPASRLGEDNEYVYKQLMGYSDAEYQWFIDNGHAGTRIVTADKPPAR